MLGGANGLNNFGGTRAPDLIGVLKVDQAWGLFQVSAVAHNNHAGYYGGAGRSEPAGHPDDKWGLAVQGALQFKNIPTGAGDVINLQAVYTDGATRYNLQSLAAVGYSMFGGTNLPGAYQSIGFANAPDAVYTGTRRPVLRTSGPGASAVVTTTTGIPTGTLASTVLTLPSSTATTARLSSARTRLLCWPWLVPATPTSTSLRRVSSPAGPL